jgi:branched-chain amino acid transport system substrate-binding protein
MIQRNYILVCFIILSSLTHLEAIIYSVSAQQTSEKSTIRIGLMVSNDPGIDPLSREAIDAAKLAIEGINENGGIGGRNTELLIRTGDGDWGSGSIKSVELIYDEEVHAIIGSLEGRDAHLVEMAIAKAHVIYLETRSADPTLSEANLPWFFRVVPSDKQQVAALVTEIYDNRQLSNLLVIHSDSYDDEMAADTFLRYLQQQLIPKPDRIKFSGRSPDYKKLLQNVKSSSVDGVLIFSNSSFLYKMSNEMILSGYTIATVYKPFGNV